MPSLLTCSLGLTPYAESLELMRSVARARIEGAIAEDVLLLVEHPSVVTLGRSSKDAHLVASRELLARQGVELFEVERGGDVTLHAPGQLVGYPIIDLKRHRQDLHWYLRQLEEALMRALGGLGLPSGRNPGYTGVWTSGRASTFPGPAWPGSGAPDAAAAGRTAASGRKIASIGVHAKDWVTWHGFALNVTTDLSLFNLIVPCGIPGVQMTSIAAELSPDPIEMSDVAERVTQTFAELFNLSARHVSSGELSRDALAG